MLSIKLGSIKKGMSHKVGGKAYEIGVLKQQGVNVPQGFVFTSEALDQYLNQLRENDMTRYEKLLSGELNESQCNDWFNTIQMQEKLIEELKKNVQPEKYYAVRSSSSLEDLEDSSFAGQYKTVLNVRGVPNIERAVKACWASFWNERSKSYKLNHSIDRMKGSHHVLIQEMIIGEVSGVAFSANPLNGRRDEVVMDAAWGLCEGVVNGLVTSDNIIIDKCKKNIKHYDIRDKANQVIAKNEGIKTQPVPDEKRNKKCLSDGIVKDIVAHLEKIENSLNQPVDIEWTIDKGKLFILQARPITTLLPLLDERRDCCKDPIHIYVDFNTVSQGVKEPMTPIGQETQNYYFSEAYTLLTGRSCNYPKWLTFVKGRLYIDLTVFMGRKSWWKSLADKISVKDPSVGEGLIEVMTRNEDALKKSDIKFRLPPKLPLRMFKHIYIPMVKGFLKGKKYPDSASGIAKEYGDKTLEQVRRLFNSARTPEEIIKAIRRAQPIMMKFSFIQYSYCAYGFIAIKKAEKITRKYQIDCDMEKIRRSMPTNPTTIMGHEMIELAQFFHQNQKEKLKADHPKIKAFMERYGHRGNVEMDIGTPRWDEEPKTVIKMIQGYIDSPNLNGLEKQIKQESVDAELEISKIYTQLCKKTSQKKAKKVYNLLNDYRKLAGLREQPKFDLMRINKILRQQLLIIGEILEKEAKISDISDVAFMNEALISGLPNNLKDIIEDNRSIYELNQKTNNLPPIMTSKGECIYGPANTEKGLSGYPVAPGEAIGRVKIMMKPDAASIEKGDVILTYSTNPSWTPLFILAGGLIMESGGVMSHGSIVAREYGIPAVVLAGSTQFFEDGQLVKVDGNNGSIEIIEEDTD